MSRRIVIVGATSRIAECCARLWAAQGAEFLLLGRDATRLEQVAADLRVRGGQCETRVFDAGCAPDVEGLVDGAYAWRDAIDLLLIAHGTMPPQERAQQDLGLARQVLEINGVSVCLIAEAFAGRMLARGAGTLAIIGSVAGDRGRQSNYLYGAAKGLVARYAEGLRHRLHGTGVSVVLIKPGPTETPMTVGADIGPVTLAQPEDVAHEIVRGIDAGRRTIYCPAKWRWIMALIRHVPERLFLRWRI
ncbi:MAG: SDR family NAD(P)-dependent oxidoreductase [Rhodocyclaceae bacterium]|nr:SDR family NAD(P)-dependent oxidoreductase [Rhodocyclaceae bacterium]